jgi:hypothetical protein
MLFRSVLQIFALLAFLALGIIVLLAAGAHFDYLGPRYKETVDGLWVLLESDSVQKFLAGVGAALTLMISAAGVYKTWRFADLNLPIRLEELAERWRRAAIRVRADVVPELAFTTSLGSLPARKRSGWETFLSLFYDPDQAALLKCSRYLDRSEADLRALTKSRDHCLAEVRTRYLELGSLMRRCDPQNGQAALNLFEKPLEFDDRFNRTSEFHKDWDALELAAHQACALGLRRKAGEHLTKLAKDTDGRHPLRHGRALRFHAEALHGGTTADERLASSKLEMAIIAIQRADARDLEARAQELGLAYKMLAEVQIALKRFRMARSSISNARKSLGDIDSLKELENRATPKR